MHLLKHRHPTKRSPGDGSSAQTDGWVMNMGWRYDAMVWTLDTIVFRGKLRALHERGVALADLKSGEAVLDVGCGTGTLALLAKERVGDSGRVSGIDPGARQIARARQRAARRNLEIDFRVGTIEALPFADRSFGVVLSALMMHHLPDELKRRGMAEIERVLVPGGRLVIVDFKRKETRRKRPPKLGAGALGIQDLPKLAREAGLPQIDSGELPLPWLMGSAGAGWLRAKKSAAPTTSS